MIYDNTDIIREFIRVLDTIPDKRIIHITIIARKKDNPLLDRTIHIIKDYYITCEKEFDLNLNEMKILSKTFNARVYINLDTKSMFDIHLALSHTIIDKFAQDQRYNLSYMLTSNVTKQNGKTRHFLVDIDCKDDEIISLVWNYLKDYIIKIVETPHGFHYICNKFNTKSFKDLLNTNNINKDTVDVKKNAFTLLYYEQK